MAMKYYRSDDELREDVAKSLQYRDHKPAEERQAPVSDDDRQSAEDRLRKILEEIQRA